MVARLIGKTLSQITGSVVVPADTSHAVNRECVSGLRDRKKVEDFTKNWPETES
jgi:hypothetical protein